MDIISTKILEEFYISYGIIFLICLLILILILKITFKKIYKYLVNKIFNFSVSKRFWSAFKEAYKTQKQNDKNSLMNIRTPEGEKILYEIYGVINSGLYHLLRVIDGKRIMILEFHNGERYFSNFSRLKFSCTYEKVRPGITSMADKIRDLEVTAYWSNFIQFLFYRESHRDVKNLTVKRLNEFVEEYGIQLNIDTHLSKDNKYEDFYILDVEDIDVFQGAVRNLIKNVMGSRFILFSPFYDDIGFPLGLILLDFDEIDDVKSTMDIDFLVDLRDFIEEISLVWQTNLEVMAQSINKK